MAIRVKRIYESAAKADGYRVLVDRLWPRGVSKAGAAVDLWLRDVAPSSALRNWFNHDPVRWAEFQQRYHAELREKSDELLPLIVRAKIGVVTLVYSARDEAHNQAVALQAFLTARVRGKPSSRGPSTRSRPG